MSSAIPEMPSKTFVMALKKLPEITNKHFTYNITNITLPLLRKIFLNLATFEKI